jgi:hypothetical protein
MEAVAYPETSVYIYTKPFAVPRNHNSVKSEVLSPSNICNIYNICNICNIYQETRNILSIETLSSCNFFTKLPMHVYTLSSCNARCEGLFLYRERPKLIRLLRKVVSNQDLKGCFFKIHFSILLQSLKWSLTSSSSD